MKQHFHQRGAVYAPEATTFYLWAPTSRVVLLRIYSTGSVAEGGRMLHQFHMKKSEGGLFWLTVPGDWHGYYYDFRLHYSSGTAATSADPFAVACGINGKRSMVVDLSRTDPEGWEDDHRVTPSIGTPAIWEVHVRDFSAAEDSGVRPAWRGKYLGFTEEHTARPGGFPTCVSYLKQLGVTHVQLQPIADYATVDETTCFGYNWGYDIMNYNIPEGSYATDPFHGEVRIRECKQMIQALHRAGIGVILDVVYNHTYYSTKSWLHKTAPGEYYRHDAAGGFMNASGCGTETASERTPFHDYMLDSLRYWAEEYHVDGFRFDLMAIHDVDTMNDIRAMLDSLPGGKRMLVYGEPWAALPVDLHEPFRSADKSAIPLLHSRIGAFSDATRDILAGSVSDPTQGGYSSGILEPWMKRSIQSAVCGWCRADLDHYMAAPSQVVQYASCHDNYTLYDRMVLQEGHDFNDPSPEVLRRIRLVSGVYLTCMGAAFLHAGEEFCRTKYGNGNTYNGPAEVNQLDWSQAERFQQLADWYAGLLRLRKDLYGTMTADVAESIRFANFSDDCVAFSAPCRPDGPWAEYFICYYPPRKELRVPLPDGEWYLLCDGLEVLPQPRQLLAETYVLPPASVVIFGRKKHESFRKGG